MSERVGLNPKWFEPGPDGESPFVRKYNASPGTAGEAVAAAFRALIAGEEATEPPALRVGDVVRLERWEDGTDGMDFYDNLNAIVGKECPILAFSKVYPNRALVYDALWPVSACTLVRRAGEAAPVAKDAEIARLMAEVERLSVEPIESARVITIRNQRNELAALNRAYTRLLDKSGYVDQMEVERLKVERDDLLRWRAAMNRLRPDGTKWFTDVDVCVSAITERLKAGEDAAAQRDALQARIDAGVRAWEKWKQQCGSLWLWAFPGVTASLCWAEVCDALNAQPDHFADAAMVDERTGKADRRTGWPPLYVRQFSRDGLPDRRRTTGTIADRGKVSL